MYRIKFLIQTQIDCFLGLGMGMDQDLDPKPNETQTKSSERLFKIEKCLKDKLQNFEPYK